MNLAMRRREFESLGGFDTVLWMTEDTDLGYRASRMSIPLAYCPRAVGFHNHPRTLQQRCAQVRDSAMWTVRLFHKHPDMRGLLPVYREIEPVSWRDDGLRMIARKLGRRTIALPVFRAFMESTLRAGEAHLRNAHVLGFLYWKVLSAHRTIGFLEGLQRWGKL